MRTSPSIGARVGILAGLLCLAAAGLAFGGQAGHTSLQQRVRDVASELRCPICHGESVYDSPAALAGNMRSEIRARLAAGESVSQVENFFVSRYGQWILLAPPKSGIGLLAWIAPPLLAILGLVLLTSRILAWRRNRTQ